MPAPSRQFEAALRIVETLRAEGHQAYFAGGCVRDLLLGRTPLDYDVTTSATPEMVLELFPRTFAVGAHFGVVLVADETLDETPPLEDAPDSAPRYSVTEVATFRCDGIYSDGRHPDEVRYTMRPEEDVQRRDFTINGLLLDPLRGGRDAGQASGDARTVCARRSPATTSAASPISTPALSAPSASPHRRFQEDQLRLLRAVRFAARFGYTIEPATLAAIRALARARIQVGQPRARARRADQNADRRPRTPRLRAAGRDRSAGPGAAGNLQA